MKVPWEVLLIAALTALLALSWMTRDVPAEPWVCTDVPCESALQCPPTCSSCWGGRCQP